MDFKKEIANIMLGFYGKPNRVVYISGKVTDLDPVEVQQKFLQAEATLKNYGFCTFNPTRWISPTADWQDAMRICIAILPVCDGIYLLPDWIDSKGAKIERDTAVMLGIPTIEL